MWQALLCRTSARFMYWFTTLLKLYILLNRRAPRLEIEFRIAWILQHSCTCTNPCILHEIHHGNIFMSGLETCGSGIGSARVGGNVSELCDLKTSKYQLLGRFSRPLCQLKMSICYSVGNLINNLLTPCCGWLGRIALSKMKMWGGQPFLFERSFRFYAVL